VRAVGKVHHNANEWLHIHTNTNQATLRAASYCMCMQLRAVVVTVVVRHAPRWEEKKWCGREEERIVRKQDGESSRVECAVNPTVNLLQVLEVQMHVRIRSIATCATFHIRSLAFPRHVFV